MFVMGMKDELIPSTQMARLYEAAKNTKFKEKVKNNNVNFNIFLV